MTATDTYTLLRAFCDELVRCGLREACTSPGSRSTPLVLSLARQPGLRCWSHIDERCAGFFALGAAKAAARPVAMACTSGTAAANYLPAIVEAHWARVPIIVLTADRPAELRDVGAGQTIDQIGLYGGAVKWFFEVAVDTTSDATLRWMRALACRAYATAAAGPPGPVHLNFPLREPLVLDAPLPPDTSGRPDGRPWVSTAIRRPAPEHAPEPGGLGALPDRGVVVMGGGELLSGGADGHRLAEAAVRFAAAAGYPLLADPLSGARRGQAAVAHYDLLLRDQGLTDVLRPELVIRLGDLPTSKPLRQWLARLDGVRQVALDPDRAWQDPDAVVGERYGSDPVTVLDGALLAKPRAREAMWLARWLAADRAASAAIEATLGDELSEPLVARSLAAWLPPDATLYCASSMPIRDLEEFVAVREAGPAMLANRGANGIDGTVSAAFGAAAASAGPVVLLIGDVALAHDLGGLLAARRLGLALTIVLLDNDGGGIFHFLPVAGETDAFEEHVATPHGLPFAEAAALYGCRHTRAQDPASLRAALERSLPGPGTTIIEVRTDREQNLALHRQVTDAAVAAARRAARVAPPASSPGSSPGSSSGSV